MSKLVKNMLVDDLKKRLDQVGDLVVVSLGRLNAQKTTQLRQVLRKKKIQLQLVKNSLARRATLDTPLAPAFEQTEGMLAIAWGGEDVVDLAKELDRLTAVKDFVGLECRGGALDGARLNAADVKQVAKWPTRSEQLSILSGQISSLGAKLSGQILSVGANLASQISSRVDDLEKAASEEAASVVPAVEVAAVEEAPAA
ncbi:MAG: 50S ribosomal protein L10 [Planctomycetes bacterium]|nr:50S ribosomal protein L10 [Planctomycetota bacterium]